MGFALSWLAVRGKAPQRILDELGIRATGEREEIPESPITGARLPGGWFLIVMQGPAIVADTVIDLPRLSMGAEVVTCFVEEHAMCSTASGWAEGREIWCVTHESRRGLRHLDARGDLPAHWKDIARRRTGEQDAAGDAEVDFFFEIPLDLAERRTGYRHDQDRVGGVVLTFEVLE